MKINGVITKKIIYDNGFTILKIKNNNETFTLTGYCSDLYEKMAIEADVIEKKHPKYGQQYEIISIKPIEKDIKQYIINYLSSNEFYFVGKITATNILEKFGKNIIEILDNTPEKLLEVNGIGEIKYNNIIQTWQKNKNKHKIYIELLQLNVPYNKIPILLEKYNNNEIVNIIKQNPYSLINELDFTAIELIAYKLNFDKKHPYRIQAAIIECLISELEIYGHCFVNDMNLVDNVYNLLNNEIDKKNIFDNILNLEKQQKIIYINDKIMLPYIYEIEQNITNIILNKINQPANLLYKNIEKLKKDINQIFNDIECTDEQLLAIFNACNSNVSIITGGPGVGKTYITNIICKLFNKHNIYFKLCAPTGRAAKRITEVTNEPAFTIHRLLKYVKNKGFTYNKFTPLKLDVLIVDEMSMVDLFLFNNLLEGISPNTKLILIGDYNQLPSIGAGNILKDLIKSQVINTNNLTKIHRQAEKSLIIKTAYNILNGNFPNLPTQRTDNSQDCIFININEPENVLNYILDLLKKYINDNKILNDIQVLTPIKQGILGTINLNKQLQQIINPPTENKNEIQYNNIVFRENDKIMNIKNDYDFEVYNGEIGYIKQINLNNISDAEILIYYPELNVTFKYDYNKLENIQHAYAITVHKSQGTEYKIVIFIIHDIFKNMLRRNLVYTGITRSKKICCLIGTNTALQTAILNTQEMIRNTNLKELLTKKI